jgi:CelD/BcsL family acetyltransferase involved in cellulose biosynthesis
MTDELTRQPVGVRLPAPRAAQSKPGRPREGALGSGLDGPPCSAPGPAPGPALAAEPGTGAAADPVSWTAEVCTDDALWEPGTESCAQWDRLWSRCPGTTVFQHSAWLGSWWAAYGEPGKLRVVLIRHDGELVAAAPLRLCRRGPLALLTMVGNGISDFGGVLVAERQPAALAELRTALVALRRPIDLRELPAGSDVRVLTEEWPHRVRTWPDSACLSLPARSFDETVRALPRRTAARVRNKSRRIDALGVLALTTPADQAAETVAELLRLHKEQWQDRGISPEHLTERFSGHLSRAVPALIRAGHADLMRYQIDGELLGCELLLHSPGVVGSYLSGLSPRLRQRIDLATLMLRSGMGVAIQREAAEYSMLRGLETYKLRWSPCLERSERILLGSGPNPTTWAYALSVASRKRAVKLAKKVLRREDHTAQDMRARLGDTDWTDPETS